MIRKFRAETEGASPAWRPGWHPLGNPYVRKALGIEG